MTTSAPTKDDVKQRIAMAYEKGHAGYIEWSKTYETDLVVAEWQAPAGGAKELASVLGDNKGARILDVCAGTGLLAQELLKHGFSNIDAVDASQDMLEISRGKNLYKNIYCQMISATQPTPGLEENSYDAAAATGAFSPNALTPDALREFVRVVKRGGFVVVAMNATHPSPLSREDFQVLFDKLESEGLAKLKHTKQLEKYIFDKQGIVYVLDVL